MRVWLKTEIMVRALTGRMRPRVARWLICLLWLRGA